MSWDSTQYVNLGACCKHRCNTSGLYRADSRVNLCGCEPKPCQWSQLAPYCCPTMHSLSLRCGQQAKSTDRSEQDIGLPCHAQFFRVSCLGRIMTSGYLRIELPPLTIHSSWTNGRQCRSRSLWRDFTCRNSPCGQCRDRATRSETARDNSERVSKLLVGPREA